MVEAVGNNEAWEEVFLRHSSIVFWNVLGNKLLPSGL